MADQGNTRSVDMLTLRSLFPHMSDMYFDSLKLLNLGLPNQASWTNCVRWMRFVAFRFRSNDRRNTQILLLACIRYRCSFCREPCQKLEVPDPIESHGPVLFPCGHVLGESCFEALTKAYKEDPGASPICPFNGPCQNETAGYNTKPCPHRIIHDCGHDLLSHSAKQAKKKSAKMPIGWQLQSDGWIPANCRVCITQEYLDKWTIGARIEWKNPLIYMRCGTLRGLPEVEIPEGFDGETPTPVFKDGRKPLLSTMVTYWTEPREEDWQLGEDGEIEENGEGDLFSLPKNEDGNGSVFVPRRRKKEDEDDEENISPLSMSPKKTQQD
ncbi:hypothetical protein DER45DRAFT_647233 [Fusarium avenaceum]|nr:hypothetical protein DER45DRAFT_647233 [Fusarium avenaceum]